MPESHRPPAEAPRKAAASRIGIFGGSFDPVHSGHLHVARAAQAAFALDEVHFVPAARPPHKPGRVLASPEDRVAMLEIAVRGQPSWRVCEVELGRSGPSYTIDTVRELASHLTLPPGAQLFLILGWDNLRGLEKWREAPALLDLVQPIVVWRGEDDPALLPHLRRELGDGRSRKLERGLLRLPPAPESSTELREKLGRGEDPGSALPPGVLEYVRRRGIYRSPA